MQPSTKYVDLTCSSFPVFLNIFPTGEGEDVVVGDEGAFLDDGDDDLDDDDLDGLSDDDDEA